MWLVVPLATRASHVASFTPHDEFVPEPASDGKKILAEAYQLAFDDPDGSEGETGMRGSAPAPEPMLMVTSRRTLVPRWSRRGLEPTRLSRRAFTFFCLSVQCLNCC